MFCANCGSKLNKNSKFCGSCGTPAGTANVGNVKNAHPKETVVSGGPAIEFFAVSSGRLALLSICTFGFYEIYWFYRNWSAIKKAENANISPFWRSVFTVFFCHSLFKKVIGHVKSHNRQELLDGNDISYSPGWLATAYILLLFFGSAWGWSEVSSIGFNLVGLAIASCTFIPLLSVQKAINFSNEQSRGRSIVKKNFSGGEVAVIVVGIILFVLVLWGIFLP